MATINTVCGPIPADRLGRTLMHEHLVSGMAGWEQDTLAPGPSRRALVALCIDRVEELKANGYQSMVDPCPNDLGRDLDLMREVSARTVRRQAICDKLALSDREVFRLLRVEI